MSQRRKHVHAGDKTGGWIDLRVVRTDHPYSRRLSPAFSHLIVEVLGVTKSADQDYRLQYVKLNLIAWT